jgi:hypothetical protein
MGHPLPFIQAPLASFPVIGPGGGNLSPDIASPTATAVANPDDQSIKRAIMAGHTRPDEGDDDVNQNSNNSRDLNPAPDRGRDEV